MRKYEKNNNNNNKKEYKKKTHNNMGDDLLGERTTDEDSLNKTQQRNRTKNCISK